MKIKYLFLPIICGISNLTAQNYNITIDSSYFKDLPSNRSIENLGGEIAQLVDNNREGKSTLYKTISYVGESFLSYRYLTALHELGHANSAGKSDIRFDYKIKNWWEYNLKYNQFGRSRVYVCENKSDFDWIKFNLAGINSTTHFLETQYDKLNLIFKLQCQFSSIIYIINDKGEIDSDFNFFERYTNITKKKIVLSQLVSFGLSEISNVQFYSYLNRDGISIRAVNNLNGYNIAVESLLSGDNYNCELAISKSFKYKKFNINPEIITSLNGVGYNISVGYKNFTIGYRNPNLSTLSGARESNKEFYMSIKI